MTVLKHTIQKHHKCLLCASAHLEALPGYYETHGLVRCRSCAFVFMENIPDIKTLDQHYSRYCYTEDDYLSPVTIKSYNALLDEFEPYRSKNRILDIGCGRGWFLLEARKRDWAVFGTEYSDTAIRICTLNGLQMKSGQLNADAFSAGSFDIITSFEVIEHINNPIEEIGCIYKFLRDGGLFYCTTPNYNAYLRYYLKASYNIINYPEHLSYYTKRTLRKLMTEQGFKTQKVLSTGISITRLKTSRKTGSEQLISEENADEVLRRRISKRWYLIYLKAIVNYLLSIFGLGITLKGYFIKKGGN